MRIDIYHDTVCPWCRIGKRHLQLALAEWQGEAVELHYHTFYLNAGMPPEGVDFRPYMQEKLGGQAPLEAIFERPRLAGESVGLTFNFDAITKSPNTQLSHQLIYLTPADQRESVIDALYAAYFEQGQDIGDIEVLLKVAESCGLDAASLREQLKQGGGLSEVENDLQAAQQIGITGVPFFILNEKLAFSGAQPPALILKALAQAAAM